MEALLQDTSTPKYARLASQLKAQIENGRLKPGDRLPSFSEMRVQYGATAATVERVFAALERDGLIQREQGRGTFVTERKSFPIADSNVIGVTASPEWVKNAPYWSHLLRGIQEVAHERGLQILLMGEVTSTVPTAQMQSLRGLLCCDSNGAVMTELASKLIGIVPCVSLTFPLSGFGSVSSDDFGGARAVTEHLLQLGHKRIACLSGGGDSASTSRRAGFRAALRSAGITPNENWIRQIPGEAKMKSTFGEMGGRAMYNWIQAGWASLGCTALICQNDETAIGAMDALREAGFRVPQDVSVAGFDGTEAGTFCSPRLTSVALPLEEIGAAGVEMLLEGTAATIVLPFQLIVRESTGPAPGNRG